MSIIADATEPAAAGDSRDVSVVRVIVTGVDREAEFAAFMESAAPSLARTAWLLCGDAHQADELVQQTLVRTYLAWSRARERDPLAYARRTLANLRIETWRRRRREVLMDPAVVPESDEASGADRHAEARPWSAWVAAPPAAIIGPEPTTTPSITPTVEPAPTPSVTPTVEPNLPVAETYWYTLRQTSYAGEEHREESGRSPAG